MATNNNNGFLSFNEYASLAYSHGLKNLNDIAEKLCFSKDRVCNFSCSRIREREHDKRYFYLEAKDSGWI
jgi:hypothetical protein